MTLAGIRATAAALAAVAVGTGAIAQERPASVPPAPLPGTAIPELQAPVLTLDDALARAFRDSPLLEAGRQGAVAAREAGAVAASGWSPVILGVASYDRQTGNYVSRPGTTPVGADPQVRDPSGTSYNYWSFLLTLRQPIFNWPTIASMQAAGALERSADEDLRRTRMDLWSTVVMRYYSVLAAQEMVEVARRTLEISARHAGRARDLVQAGARPKIDAVRTEVDLRNSEAALIAAEDTLRVTQAELLGAIGAPESFRFTTQRPSTPPPGEPAQAPEAGSHPEHRVLQARVEAQEAEVRVAWGAWIPRLDADAGVSEAGRALDDMVWNWRVGVALTVPLFPGTGPIFELRQAKASLAITRANLADLDIQIRTRTDQARAQVADAEARLPPLQAALDAARETLAMAAGRYEAGAGGPIELLDAEGALANAEAALVRGRYEVAAARVNLARATGTAPTGPGSTASQRTP